MKKNLIGYIISAVFVAVVIAIVFRVQKLRTVVTGS